MSRSTARNIRRQKKKAEVQALTDLQNAIQNEPNMARFQPVVNRLLWLEAEVKRLQDRLHYQKPRAWVPIA